MPDDVSHHLCNNNNFWEDPVAYVPRNHTDRIENNASKNSFIFACVYVDAVKIYRAAA